jgi:molecular chaperone GrpE
MTGEFDSNDDASVGEQPAPAQTAEPEPAATEPLTTLLLDLKRSAERMESLFRHKIQLDAGREAMIDRLHAEIQEYKEDFVLKILKPLANGLINLHDDIGKHVAIARTKQGDPSAMAVADALASVQEDIEDTLERVGIESFVTEQPEFDPKRQKIVRTMATAEQSLDRTVGERLRKGFVYDGKIIRPELVNVYVAEAPARAEPQP